MFKNNSGFTLIEMLIVLTIISVLIILFVPKLSDSSKDINKKGCNALVTVVQAQTNLFHIDKGRYPLDLDELAEDDYITEKQLKCSDDTALTYEAGKVSIPNKNND